MKTIKDNELTIQIFYNKKVEKFLLTNEQIISESTLDKLLIKSIKKINGEDVNIDLGRLHGKFENLYRIRKGKIRIIFSVFHDIIYILLMLKILILGEMFIKKN